jgi:ParB-like chromosome segregation protein Spo0J
MSDLPIIRFFTLHQLKTHPRNMRRFYVPKQVAEMATSLKACGGNKIAMQVVPADEPGTYFVVDGNLRLAGGRHLGVNCPPLKGELVSDSEAEQLLTMVVANGVRYDPDVISEALHYRRLIDEEGYSVDRIAAATGKHKKTIDSALAWLKLEPEIQDLAAKEELPRDRRAVDALLSIPAGKARVKLATRLAETGATITTIQQACVRLSETYDGKNGKKGAAGTATRKMAVPSLEIPAAEGPALPSDKVALTWPALRKAARQMCNACDIKTEALYNKVDEPAWVFIAHAATDTCTNCSLRLVQATCKTCPGVEIIRQVIASLEDQKEAADVQHLEPAPLP